MTRLTFTTLLLVCFVLTTFGQNEKYIRQQDSIRKLWTDTTFFFPRHKFAKVVGYTFNKGIVEEGNYEEQSILIGKTNKLAKSVDPKSFTLTKLNTKALLNILNDTTTFQDGSSGCFIPHHAFVFYDSEGNAVAHITICFMCHQTEAEPFFPILRYGGLDDRGWKRLYDFCKGLGMPMKEEKK